MSESTGVGLGRLNQYIQVVSAALLLIPTAAIATRYLAISMLVDIPGPKLSLAALESPSELAAQGLVVLPWTLPPLFLALAVESIRSGSSFAQKTSKPPPPTRAWKYAMAALGFAIIISTIARSFSLPVIPGLILIAASIWIVSNMYRVLISSSDRYSHWEIVIASLISAIIYAGGANYATYIYSANVSFTGAESALSGRYIVIGEDSNWIALVSCDKAGRRALKIERDYVSLLANQAGLVHSNVTASLPPKAWSPHATRAACAP